MDGWKEHLTSRLTADALVTAHEVVLTGLPADTRYYYSVGDASRVYVSGADYYFETHPPVGSTGPTRIWVLGDSGTADANARNVREAYKTANGGNAHADLLLMLGDNAYDNGTNDEVQAAVFGTYPETLRNTVLRSYEEQLPFYHFRHAVKPGITGWAQVNNSYGASLSDALEKLCYDLYYVRHYSLLLDFSIIVKTIYIIIFARGR